MHPAAILPQKGARLLVEQRATPEPGPEEVVVRVHAVALNPIDHMQRDKGIPPLPQYPAVLGCDVAGIVAKVGSNVRAAPPVGSRVIAFASSFYHDGAPDYGAFQQMVAVREESVVALPDSMSFTDGVVVPLAFLTALTAYTAVGIPIDAKAPPQEAILIWGAASSVGTYAVQTAKLLGFRVYATASAKNHAYIKQLGADAVFDYKHSAVVSQIVDAVQKDGARLLTAHCCVPGVLQPTLDVLKAVKGDAHARVAHSPMLPDNNPVLDNTEIKFNCPPSGAAARNKHISACFHGWLAPTLQAGTIVPSPRAQVHGRGLEAIDSAVDVLKAGVSAEKVVVLL